MGKRLRLSTAPARRVQRSRNAGCTALDLDLGALHWTRSLLKPRQGEEANPRCPVAVSVSPLQIGD